MHELRQHQRLQLIGASVLKGHGFSRAVTTTNLDGFSR
jgi:hypothetical protein